MIGQYIDHFRTGNMQTHRESQITWIEDKQPAIETNIGFIESYLDPLKVRAEFEGFVAVVNKEESALLTKLVDGAQGYLKLLPWGSDFEAEEFKKPDFTSLEVLAFGTSGIPIGINIPNYDDIREKYGFKNVNLGNAYGKPTAKTVLFTPDSVLESCLKYSQYSTFVNVSLHELLGHGSGRLLHKKPDFQNPLTNGAIESFYQENETWGSVFGGIASTYEECRAEAVALYLCTFDDIQEVLLPKLNKEERDDVTFVLWFNMLAAGLRSFEFYNPNAQKFLQAHMGARFAIFRVLEAAKDVFEIKQIEIDGKPSLELHLNRKAILTTGKEAIGNFLKHLQVYKSTADAKNGTAFFSQYLKLEDRHQKYREIVLQNKKPRRISVQGSTSIVDGKAQYKMHSADAFGCIDSAIAHYGEDAEGVIDQWNKNNQEFKY